MLPPLGLAFDVGSLLLYIAAESIVKSLQIRDVRLGAKACSGSSDGGAGICVGYPLAFLDPTTCLRCHDVAVND